MPTSAIYRNEEGVCKKAYLLQHEVDLTTVECGLNLPELNAVKDDPLHRISNQSRTIVTPEATLWPHPDACADWFTPTEEQPYVCLITTSEAMSLTGMTDIHRISRLPDYPYPGIWKIANGDPTTITIPPGYVVDYYALEGIYVTFD